MMVNDFSLENLCHWATSAASGSVLVMTGVFLVAGEANAHNNKVSITTEGGKRCVVSNGLPNHGTGTFPNSGNPHRISAQNVRVCVTLNPKKSSRAREIRGSIGIGVNGVQFRPATADYYDPSSKRGFSRNSRSGWRLDGMGARRLLGLDQNNAHVDNRGLYHYHGIAGALTRTSGSSLIGWAADGFEIHYVGNQRTSGWALKKGTRPSGPGGSYDGTYVEDWQYVGGSGRLDRCNGGTLNGKFVYFATNTFPYLPHCLWGRAGSDFKVARGGSGQRLRANQHRQRSQSGGLLRRIASLGGNRRPPPREAIAACEVAQEGARCSFRPPSRGRAIRGFCRTVRSSDLACVPRR